MRTKWSSNRSSGSSQRGRFFRPELETLEDRLTPSSAVVNWSNAVALLPPSQSGIVGSNAMAALQPSQGGVVGTMVGISAAIGMQTGDFSLTVRMIQGTCLAVDNYLLSQPATQANPSLTADLTADANMLNSVMNANVATTPMAQAAGGIAYNMTLMGLRG